MARDEDITRVTIVTARYGGIYEPGKWLAFAGGPRDLPEEWDAGDSRLHGLLADAEA